MMYMFFEKFKPGVNTNFLLFFSGILWISVGIMLNTFAYHWLAANPDHHTAMFAGIGFIAALIIHHFGFLRVVDKNLGRISKMEGKPCAFSFMSCKSYLMVLVMMSMGIGLRHSPIPKPYLAALYIGIGGALILSSVRYFRVLIHQIQSGSHS